MFAHFFSHRGLGRDPPASVISRTLPRRLWPGQGGWICPQHQAFMVRRNELERPMRPHIYLPLLLSFTAPAVLAQEQDAIDAGAAVYENNCSVCHGPRLRNPGGSFDLRALTADERQRFDIGVLDGKNMMPPWRGTISEQELDQLWAYIRAYAYE